jgi:hypothetical protein
VKPSPSRAPLLHAPGETRCRVPLASAAFPQTSFSSSSNPRLQRTPAALPPSPLSRKPLDDRPEGSVA